jgi:hypothetical protein
MATRSFGIAATITRSAAPFLKSAAATWLIAWRQVRSLVPISTLPLLIGITSPPSNVARPWSFVGSPHQTVTFPASLGGNCVPDQVDLELLDENFKTCRSVRFS